jgi:hypothetical protein
MGSGTGFSDGLARCSLILINIIFFLCGGVVLSFGIIALANPTLIVNLFDMIPNIENLQYYVNITQALLNNAILLTCIGGVIVILTILGCLGATMRNNGILIIYIILVLLLILFELAFVMWASIEKQQIYTRFADLMYTSLTQNFQPIQTIINNTVVYSSSTPALAWESLQFRYSCCGAINYTDYQRFTWNNTISVNGVLLANAVVPPSCCLQTSLYNVPSPTAYFVNLTQCLLGSPSGVIGRVTTGCYVAIIDQLSQYTFITVIIIASLIAVEVFVMLLSTGSMKHDVKKVKP